MTSLSYEDLLEEISSSRKSLKLIEKSAYSTPEPSEVKLRLMLSITTRLQSLESEERSCRGLQVPHALNMRLEQLVVKQKEMFTLFQQQKQAVSKAIPRIEYDMRGRLALPDLTAYMPLSTDIRPFVWAERQRELDAAPDLLLRLLTSWVKVRANPQIHNTFFDVRPLALHSLVAISVGGVGNFSGVPDAIVPHPSLGSFQGVSPISRSARLSIDWVSTEALSDQRTITTIGHIRALTFGELSPRPVPVFFTDMNAGFRCWIVIERTLYYLHPDDELLSLAEGVALIRYFLSNSDVDGSSSSIRVSNGTLVIVKAEVPSSSSLPESVERGSSDCADRSDSGSGGGPSAVIGGDSGTTSCNDTVDDCGGSTSCRFRVERKGDPPTSEDSGESDCDADIWKETILAIARTQKTGGGLPRLDISFSSRRF